MNTKAEAQERVLKHMRLAYRLAWKYHGYGMEPEELQAAALLGLVKASSAYDGSRGVPFPAFASIVIRNTLRMEVRKAERDQRCVSMEAPVTGYTGDEKVHTWADRIACRENGYLQAERKDLISSMVFSPELTGKEQKAVWLVVCQGMTQKEAGRQIGLSQSHVSRKVRSGIRKIRKKYLESI